MEMAMSKIRIPPPTRKEPTDIPKKRRMASPVNRTITRMIPMEIEAMKPFLLRTPSALSAVRLMKIV
jgi:hypothetical protein